MSDDRLQKRLREPGIIVAPGVFDMMTLLVANRVGFDAIFASGYWVMASQLGVPDAGIACYRDFETAFRRIIEMSAAPVIADADTGFGGTVNIDHTVRGYERIGAAAIQIEDQCFPKKCGHSGMVPVVDTATMVKRIKTAAAARDSSAMQIIARTDANAREGLDSSLRRMEAYAAAGADILFFEAPLDETEMRAFCRSFEKPKMINAAHGGRTPIFAPGDYEDIGYQVAIYPAGVPLSALQAAENFLHNLKSGTPNGNIDDMFDFADISGLLGFDRIYALEEEFGAGASS